MWRNVLIQVKESMNKPFSLFEITQHTNKKIFHAIYQVRVLLLFSFQGISILGLEHEVPAHATNVKNTLSFNAH